MREASKGEALSFNTMASARDLATLGAFITNDGTLDGKSIISK